MDFYKTICNKSKEEIQELTRKRIEELEQKNSDEEQNIIGYKIDYNPTKFEISIIDGEKSFGVDLRCFYNGYITKNSKIVYGMRYDFDGNASNDGDYYYLDDDSYIYEFSNYIRDIEVHDEYDMLYYILEFLKYYFGTFKEVDREVMNKLIQKEDGTYFPPIRKHELTDFKRKGNALCSEYATMAQNLMSVFGIESSIVIGNERVKNSNPADDTYESHAFNIVEINEPDTNSQRAYLVDFLNSVTCYDEQYNVVEHMPFLAEIEEYNDELIHKLINSEIKLEYPDYCLMYFNSSVIKLGFERTRSYYISNRIEQSKVLKKKD